MTALPVLPCLACGAPVRFARQVEVDAERTAGIPFPDVSGECIFHSPQATYRALGVGPLMGASRWA